VATAGFWTYQLIWSSPQSLSAGTSDSAQEAEQKTADLEAKLKTAEAEQQRLKDETQRQTKTAADVEAKLKSAEAEQQRLKEQVQVQTKAAADANAKLQAAQTEQQRLKDEIQRQIKATADAEARRETAEEQLKSNLAVQRASPSTPTTPPTSATLPGNQPAPTGTTGRFTIRANTEGIGATDFQLPYVRSISECEQKCAQSTACKIFSYNKTNQMCYGYLLPVSFKPNETFDSGVPNSAASPAAQSAPVVSAGPFKIITGQEAMGSFIKGGSSGSMTMKACEESCAQLATCDIFTLNLTRGLCFRYSRVGFTGLRQDGTWSSGISTSACQLTDQSSQLRLACSQ
jgi:hypothetical protein